MEGRHGATIALARSATFTRWHGIHASRVAPTRRVVAAQPGVTMEDGRGELLIRGAIATTRGDWRLTLKIPIAGTSRRVPARDRRIVTAWRRHISIAGAAMDHGRRWEVDCRSRSTVFLMPLRVHRVNSTRAWAMGASTPAMIEGIRGSSCRCAAK